MKKNLWIAAMLLMAWQCKEKSAVQEVTLFSLKNNQDIGLVFSNDLSYDKDFNIYKYRNFYNGGGVAIGDINNDGLQDVYMVSNQKENKLFLNKGNWKFEDITQKSGAAGKMAWSTGVTMVDINSDGLLDIYLCNAGDVKGDSRENELFINNGDLTFTEQAKAYHLNDKGYSTHASFFDYDKDGDLDCYILNNSFRAIGSFDLRKNQRNTSDELGGDKLMRNDNGKFVNVNKEAGIYDSEIGFGLGITVGDVNNDGWEDIFISNDFFERDYLYINQKNGKFKEDLENQILAISAASMGADIADINNDGWNDIFVTDMLPLEQERLKTVTTFDDWNRYKQGVANGYHHQFTRNTLHVNNGNNTFSEAGRLAGVEASDWSWGALFFDMDNDGQKDLYIANGIYKDITNQDYLQYIANDSVMMSIIGNKGVDYKKLIDIIPSNAVANNAYKNNGSLQFSAFEQSGLWAKGFSNGSAYGDLDNDGDLDLIVNNINMPCFVYENQLNGKNNYVKLVLHGEKKNLRAIGSRIQISDGKQSWYIENQPARGFQSSVDGRPNIGVGKAAEVDITITWPSGKKTVLQKVKTNQIIQAYEKDAKEESGAVTAQVENRVIPSNTLAYQHIENQYSDFNRENLLFQMISTQGPEPDFGDVNGDGQLDIVIPGPKGQETKVYLRKGNTYEEWPQPEFATKKEAEHVIAKLFDADKDGDLDLYLASGGVELSEYSEYLYDELYWNDGKGKFTNSGQVLPSRDHKISTGAVCHADIDGDGDEDLFIGERVSIGKYGKACSGFILLNDGKGKFNDATVNACPELNNLGMITDAAFNDLDGDGKKDLIVVGEYMGIEVYKNVGGKFKKTKTGLDAKGWWNAILLEDLDGDGDADIVAANHGMNSRFRASKESPIIMYHNDFDNNGFPESIVTKKGENGKTYPYALRQHLVSRLPALKKKFQDFESYKTADITKIFNQDILDKSQVSEVNELRSLVLINNGNFQFAIKTLPPSVQISCMYAIHSEDLDKDGDKDIIMAGNLYNVQPEFGRYDASYGHVLINDGKANFTDQSKDYGFSVKGEVRSIQSDRSRIYIFRNNDSVLEFQIK